jgi:putative FmdB family regulatory protein
MRELPVYEYKCTGGHHYEKTEGFDAPSQQACIDCGKPAQRQLSLPAVIFKGSGFYSTDNRNGNRRNGGSSDGEKADASAGASDHSDSAGVASRVEASVD